MKMSDLFKKRSEIVVKFDDTDINIAFAPNRFDSKVMTMVSGSMAPATLVDVLTHVILDWDFTDDDNAKIPVTEETVSELPVKLLMAFANGIMEEINSGKNDSNSSAS